MSVIGVVGVVGCVGWMVLGYVQHPPRRAARGLRPPRWYVHTLEYLFALTAMYALVQMVLDAAVV